MASFTINYAKQSMFDQLIEELIVQNGLSIDDACQQTLEMFADEYDMSKVYIYNNQKQYDMKLNIQRICNTITNASLGNDSFINANFCLQGLLQILPTESNCFKLLDTYKIILSLIKLLSVENKDDENDDMIGEDEDDDDDDEDANRKFQTIRCLETLQFISIEIIKNPQLVFSSLDFFNIGEDNIDILLKRLDEDIGEEDITKKLIEFLLIILSYENNRVIFKDKGGIDLLELATKMNKKNQFIIEAVEKIKLM